VRNFLSEKADNPEKAALARAAWKSNRPGVAGTMAVDPDMQLPDDYVVEQ